MTDILQAVRTHLMAHFAPDGSSEPDEAGVTFLGTDRMAILRFADPDDPVSHHVSLGCSRHPMVDPAQLVADPMRGPRAEVVVTLGGPSPVGLARSIAIVASTPAVEGLVLEPGALVDLETPLWQGAPFTAFLLGPSGVDDVVLPAPLSPVALLAAVPITPTEAAWVRLKGAEAMREAWDQDGVDVRDAHRRAVSPG
ncbi:suppressor of fused domain protein [Mycobacterium sp. SMC-4]|uniref:suppressor of fused domain protein n=1 Tax=Mycobacterium sp. SMC-4 TaxID=2857059 RepID=UPI0021B3A616|nr:suppressor of fused domain protein [Mycobacterium sp. SMC-4]UXA16816.1 suppressor of fused domain protein [Mycobacterium sp. SMC-4]